MSEAKAAELREALAEYGQHTSWRCGYPSRYDVTADECCCGLQQDLKRLGFTEDEREARIPPDPEQEPEA